MDVFDTQKTGISLRTDKSKRGEIDSRILPLVNKINKLAHYYTTSSCSGRVVVLVRDPKYKNKTQWIYVSHGRSSLNRITKALDTYLGDAVVWLKMESFILHLCCRNLSDAQKTLYWCQVCGIKRAGIITLSNKIVIEITGNEAIETIIKKGNTQFVNPQGLKELLNAANEKMNRNHDHLRRMVKHINLLT